MKKVLLAGLIVLVPVVAMAQVPTCEEQLAVTQKYAQNLEAQRFQAGVQLAQEQVKVDGLIKAAQAEKGKEPAKVSEKKK